MNVSAIPGAQLPSRKFRIRIISLAGVVVFLGIFLVVSNVNPLQFFAEFDQVKRLARDMWPPNMAMLFRGKELYRSLLETIAMAFLGTLSGGVAAVLLAFAAARNTSPHPAIRFAVRTLFVMERSTPNFVIVLIFLIAAGIGPFAGVLSLSIGTLGMFGKLFADAIEHVDHSAMEGVAAVGARRTQVIRYAALPQVTPSFIATSFYAFDVNLRAAIAFGVFGAGGIGFELNLASHVLRYRDMLAYTILIIALITAMEKISDRIRGRLTPAGLP